MDRLSFLSRSSSSLSSFLSREEKFLLPRPAQTRRFRLRGLMGHFFYRRIILWAIGCGFALCIFFTTRSGPQSQRILDLVKFNQDGKGSNGKPGVYVLKSGSETIEIPIWHAGIPHWLRFKQYVSPFRSPLPARGR